MFNWAAFFFTGACVLPPFMVALNDESFGVALMIYVMLMLAAGLSAGHSRHFARDTRQTPPHRRIDRN